MQVIVIEGKMKNRKGFILYIVVAILLVLAILAFALNSYKSGAVTQLAKNIDQNRLILIAQSANSETLAMMRSSVNRFKESNTNITEKVFENFREIFSKKNLNQYIDIIEYEPPETLKLIAESGYPIKVKTSARIKCFKDSAYKSLCAYNGFLEITSKAYLNNDSKNSMEVTQRHDLRLIDLRHYFDKYVLFLKQFCADLNNTQRNIWIHGIGALNGDISRLYLGDYNYPESSCPEDEKKIWLDVNFASMSIKIYNLFYETTGITTSNSLKKLFGITGEDLKAFEDNPSCENFLYTNKVKFKDINTFDNSDFYHVQAVKKIYEDFVNDAADACSGGSKSTEKVQRTERLTGKDLRTKCEQAMPKTNSSSAVYKICEDYVKNYKESSNELDEDKNDYSGCEIFKVVLNTCIDNWEYCYGYLDASNIWDFKDLERPDLPPNLSWNNAVAYRGLTDKNVGKGYGPFVSAYNNGYNPEEYQVGKMLNLYGSNPIKMHPVIVEGNVWLRFFKIAYFDEFEDTIPLYGNVEGKINPEPVPITFRRHNLLPETFQNGEVNHEFSSAEEYFSDKSLMSQPITSVPINALILDENGIGPEYYDKDGVKKLLTKDAVYNGEFLKPANVSDPLKIGRILDFDKVSYNYPTSKEFLEDRLGKDNVLYLDGIMYIQKGDLDLSKNEKGEEIATYSGRGLIYLAQGNVTLGVFKKTDLIKDWCEFYLRDGDFIVAPVPINHIMASMIALSNDYKNSQGSLIINNNRFIKIVGNLILDSLSLRGMAHDNEALEVMHDGMLYDPGLCNDSVGINSPYHISIGKIKTAYSVRAGEE